MNPTRTLLRSITLFAAEHKWNADDFDVSQCLTCITDDPYVNKVGAYSWACGECSTLGDIMGDLCLDCIHNRAVLAGTGLPSDLMDMAWVSDTSVVICDCIDMFKTLWGGDSLVDWWTDSCPKCTAMQKTCYRRRNITLSAIPEDGLAPFIINDTALVLPQGYRILRCKEATDHAAALDALFANAGFEACSLNNGAWTSGGTGASCTTEPPVMLPCRVMTTLPGWHLLHIDDEIPDIDTGAGGESAAKQCSKVGGAGLGAV
ncbi:hypothetical protein FOA52_009779 [Chlamydomonas sp. UWO 241]|nr:hypothetical protein FOA52_009779 [Chlamydomonas sp. UWO 241]